MYISYEEARQAQIALEDKLLLDPNVVSVGVVKETNSAGHKTGNYMIEVGLISSAKKHSIPEEYVLSRSECADGKKNKHIRICVTEVGEINI